MSSKRRHKNRQIKHGQIIMNEVIYREKIEFKQRHKPTFEFTFKSSKTDFSLDGRQRKRESHQGHVELQ